jgi:outer membrane protein
MTYRTVPMMFLAFSAALAQMREISLHEAIETALAHNLEIEIENCGRDTARSATDNALSYYDPQFTLNTSVISSNLPVSNILQTGDEASQITKSWSVAPSLQQNLPGGGTVTVSMNLSRTTSNSAYVFINPLYGSTIGFTLTQPLWRGFRRTAVERQIRVARINEHLSESQFRQKVASVVEQVIATYWRLRVTMENQEAQRQARDLAAEQYEQTKKRVAEGQDTPVTLSSSRADLASREQNAVQAGIQIEQAANLLKRLLAPNVMDPLWTTTLLPTDRPDMTEISISLPEAVKTAIDRRPELEQLRLQTDQSDAELRFSKSETRPAVNLRVEVLGMGNAGATYALSPVGIDGGLGRVIDPSNPAFGGLGTSYRQAIGFQYPSVAAGLEVKLPLRNRAATSQLAAAVAGKRKLGSQIRAMQEDILVEVRNAWESIAGQRKNVEAARLSRELAEEQLAAETVRDAKSPELARYRRDLADARVRELQALVDYQLSLTTLQKAMNTLTDEHQIVIARRN